MNINAAFPIIKLALENKINLLLKGPPGVGKSDIIKQATESAGMELMISHPVISEPTDYKGLPALVNKMAEFLPYGDLRRMIEATKPLNVFFDDVGQAANTIQAALMQITLERRIGEFKISPHVRFLMATNNRKDGAGVVGLLTPLVNRFTVLSIESDAPAWIKWALKNDVLTELIAFMRVKPELINTFKAEKDITAFASPRSITMLSHWIKAGCTEYQVWQGCVGEAFAVEFKAFYDMYKALVGWPEKIIANPKTAPLPDNDWLKKVKMEKLGIPCLSYSLTCALAARVSEVNFDSIMTYAARLPEEYGQALYIDCTSKKESLIETRTAIEWMANHAERM